MSKRVVPVALACVCCLALGASSAGASGAYDITCASDATWSISGTSATATFTNQECYTAAADAGIEQVFPEFSVDGEHGSDPGPLSSVTFTYTPIVGLCDGRLSYQDAYSTVTGVLKNDGNFHSVVEVVWTSKQSPPGTWAQKQTYVGVLQNACSSSFQTKRLHLSAGVEP